MVVALLGAALLVALGGVLLSENALRLARRPVVAPPEMRGKDVTIRAADGVRLAAWFLRPPAPNGGCVLILHGIADNRVSGLGKAPMFLDKGYAVLLPDSRAHGQSGGDLVSYGIAEKWDLLAWTAWLRAAGCRDIFGLGESMGAAVLLQAAAEKPVFRAVVAECPYASLRWIAEDRVVQHLPGPLWLRRSIAGVLVTTGFWYTRLKYGLDLDSVAPVKSVRRLHIPVLLIAGTLDKNISPDHARAIAAADPAARFWLVPGARHTTAATTDPEGFKRRVLAWFQAASTP